jgi:hypothetical protein
MDMDLIDAAALEPDELAAVEAIYVERFPDELRAPFADLLDDDVLVAVEDGRPVGLAVTRVLGPTGSVFVRYLAVAASGGGVGSRFWRMAAARWAADGYPLVLLDVEDPDEPGIDAAEKSLRERRIVFYERLGGRVLPVRDYRPSQPGGADPHPLRLLAFGDGPPVRDMVLAVYRHRYGLSSDDPAVQLALRSLTDFRGGPDRAGRP